MRDGLNQYIVAYVEPDSNEIKQQPIATQGFKALKDYLSVAYSKCKVIKVFEDLTDELIKENDE